MSTEIFDLSLFSVASHAWLSPELSDNGFQSITDQYGCDFFTQQATSSADTTRPTTRPTQYLIQCHEHGTFHIDVCSSRDPPANGFTCPYCYKVAHEEIVAYLEVALNEPHTQHLLKRLKTGGDSHMSPTKVVTPNGTMSFRSVWYRNPSLDPQGVHFPNPCPGTEPAIQLSYHSFTKYTFNCVRRAIVCLARNAAAKEAELDASTMREMEAVCEKYPRAAKFIDVPSRRIQIGGVCLPVGAHNGGKSVDELHTFASGVHCQLGGNSAESKDKDSEGDGELSEDENCGGFCVSSKMEALAVRNLLNLSQ